MKTSEVYCTLLHIPLIHYVHKYINLDIFHHYSIYIHVYAQYCAQYRCIK